MTPTESVWQEFVQEYKADLEKLFSSRVWKRSLLPWLRANREIKLRTMLASKDHSETDVMKGMILAFEFVMNLPGAVSATEKEVKEQPQQQDSTDYNDGISWPEDEIN